MQFVSGCNVLFLSGDLHDYFSFHLENFAQQCDDFSYVPSLNSNLGTFPILDKTNLKYQHDTFLPLTFNMCAYDYSVD